jgi:hypothetical protein
MKVSHHLVPIEEESTAAHLIRKEYDDAFAELSCSEIVDIWDHTWTKCPGCGCTEKEEGHWIHEYNSH